MQLKLFAKGEHEIVAENAQRKAVLGKTHIQ